MCNRWQRQHDPPLCISRGPQHERRRSHLSLYGFVDYTGSSSASAFSCWLVALIWGSHRMILWSLAALLYNSEAGKTSCGSNKLRRKEFRESALVVHWQCMGKSPTDLKTNRHVITLLLIGWLVDFKLHLFVFFGMISQTPGSHFSETSKLTAQKTEEYQKDSQNFASSILHVKHSPSFTCRRAEWRRHMTGFNIDRHRSNLDRHHAFKASSPLLRKHKMEPQLYEGMIPPGGRKAKPSWACAARAAGSDAHYENSSPQKMTKLETFVSDWVQRNEPIRGVCQGSSNHMTIHRCYHLMWQFLEWKHSVNCSV